MCVSISRKYVQNFYASRTTPPIILLLLLSVGRPKCIHTGAFPRYYKNGIRNVVFRTHVIIVNTCLFLYIYTNCCCCFFFPTQRRRNSYFVRVLQWETVDRRWSPFVVRWFEYFTRIRETLFYRRVKTVYFRRLKHACVSWPAGWPGRGGVQKNSSARAARVYMWKNERERERKKRNMWRI